jgi:hypothetical protein
VPPWLGQLGPIAASASLFSGTELHSVPLAGLTAANPSRTTGVLCSPARLTGPFAPRAGIGLPPIADSLDPASGATTPDQRLSLLPHYSTAGSDSCQASCIPT